MLMSLRTGHIPLNFSSLVIALSGHGVIDDPKQHMRILEDVRARVGAFGIEHVTFQIELRELVQLEKQDR